mmetsp:Transcript_9360/g.28157  ORF Transcript_9360/g.28157 Transcript_9360/m.28157 type:complete len:151 (-) Transcript_9360:59-511(-)
MSGRVCDVVMTIAACAVGEPGTILGASEEPLGETQGLVSPMGTPPHWNQCSPAENHRCAGRMVLRAAAREIIQPSMTASEEISRKRVNLPNHSSIPTSGRPLQWESPVLTAGEWLFQLAIRAQQLAMCAQPWVQWAAAITRRLQRLQIQC